MQSPLITFFGIVLAVSSLSGCCNEENIIVADENSSAEQLYTYLSNLPTTSILSDGNNEDRSRTSTTLAFPVFSKEDLEYIASLNQEQLISFRDSLIFTLGFDGEQLIEDFIDENYIRVFNIMGSPEDMSALEEFAFAYLDTKGGWHALDCLLPQNLTLEKQRIYVGLAVFIDKVSRPFYETLIKNPARSRDSMLCEWEAAMRLSLAGVDIGVDGLVDIMTDGAGLALEGLEDVALAADLTSIWLDYEICNGRWHQYGKLNYFE